MLEIVFLFLGKGMLEIVILFKPNLQDLCSGVTNQSINLVDLFPSRQAYRMKSICYNIALL